MATMRYNAFGYPYFDFNKKEQREVYKRLTKAQAWKKFPKGESPVDASKRLDILVKSCR